MSFLKKALRAGLTGGGTGRIADPLKLSKGKKAEKPEKTAEEMALEKRQRSMLDKEIGEQEELLKALARGRLGKKSLLKGAGAGPERKQRGGSILGSSGGGGGSGGGTRSSSAGANRSTMTR